MLLSFCIFLLYTFNYNNTFYLNGYMSVFLQIENEKLGQVVTRLLKQVITV